MAAGMEAKSPLATAASMPVPEHTGARQLAAMKASGLTQMQWAGTRECMGTEQHGVGFVGNDHATIGDISVLLYEERVLGEAAWYGNATTNQSINWRTSFISPLPQRIAHTGEHDGVDVVARFVHRGDDVSRTMRDALRLVAESVSDQRPVICHGCTVGT
jgi:hypothetical protein